MPTPAVGSVLSSARITTFQGTWHSRALDSVLADALVEIAAVQCRRRGARCGLAALRDRAERPRPGAASRRLVAIPVGAALLYELGVDASSRGAVGDRGALRRLRGPGRAGADPRRLAGGGRRRSSRFAAALGALTGHSPALAVPTMALVGAIAGYWLRRLAAPCDRRPHRGPLAADLPGPGDPDLPRAGGAAVRRPRRPAPGRLLARGLRRRRPEEPRRERAAGTAGAVRRSLSANLTLDSTAARHALGSAPRWRRASPPTGCSACTSTASGSR